MTAKTFNNFDFFGQQIFVETCFTSHFDKEAKTLMVMEHDYTDFNAVLIYDQEAQAIRVLPRWQTNFILKADGIYVVREGLGGR